MPVSRKLDGGRLCYRCRVCGKQDRRDRVVAHVLKCHARLDQVPFYCTLCNFRSERAEELMNHVTRYARHRDEVKRTGVTDMARVLGKCENPIKVEDFLEVVRESDEPVLPSWLTAIAPVSAMSTASEADLANSRPPSVTEDEIGHILGLPEPYDPEMPSMVSSLMGSPLMSAATQRASNVRVSQTTVVAQPTAQVPAVRPLVTAPRATVLSPSYALPVPGHGSSSAQASGCTMDSVLGGMRQAASFAPVDCGSAGLTGARLVLSVPGVDQVNTVLAPVVTSSVTVPPPNQGMPGIPITTSAPRQQTAPATVVAPACQSTMQSTQVQDGPVNILPDLLETDSSDPLLSEEPTKPDEPENPILSAALMDAIRQSTLAIVNAIQDGNRRTEKAIAENTKELREVRKALSNIFGELKNVGQDTATIRRNRPTRPPSPIPDSQLRSVIKKMRR